MKFGLKKTIYRELELRGEISYNEAEQIAKDLGMKSDNMTRRMRELMEKESVEPVLTEKGHIRGYRYSLNIPSPVLEVNNQSVFNF